MVDKSLLRSVIVRNGETQSKLAAVLDLTPSQMSDRVNGYTEFKASEVGKIVHRYNLSFEETDGIFFTEASS